MLGLTCQYDSNQHYLLDFEALRWCRRETADPELRGKLFAYYHLREHTYVIALWMAEPRRLFVDLMNLGGSPQNFTRAEADSFRHRMFDPVSAGQMKRELREELSNHLHEMNDMSGNQSEKQFRQSSTKVAVSMSGS